MNSEEVAGRPPLSLLTLAEIRSHSLLGGIASAESRGALHDPQGQVVDRIHTWCGSALSR